MAINKNHEFEELNGIKCGIVEKNVPASRVEFIRQLLEFNKYEVVVVPSPAPKAAAPVAASAADAAVPVPAPAAQVPETFTIGVSDYTFNTINAIFGRLLHTPDGHVVTLAYWHQQEPVSLDTIPYYEDLH